MVLRKRPWFAHVCFQRKQGLREWLHVVAPSRNTYELKYYNIDQAADEEVTLFCLFVFLLCVCSVASRFR